MIEVVFNDGSLEGNIWTAGITIFLIIWIVFVPIAITSRLERIIKVLENKS